MEASAELLKSKSESHVAFSRFKIGDNVLLLDERRKDKTIMDEQGRVYKYRVNAKNIKKFNEQVVEPVRLNSLPVGVRV
ncbi:hypothetical protein [Absidia glauca]|uniref:Uncharacterized protein n=1 Tax=Absidia glauca TaxID=4829 RepID=A0A163K9X4_ABSGL|nr:hypothetical protein [Absidia glauca]